jgi:hypothetical protein
MKKRRLAPLSKRLSVEKAQKRAERIAARHEERIRPKVVEKT